MYLTDLPLNKTNQKVYYRALRVGDYDEIEKLELREQDKEELLASTGKKQKQALLESLFGSKYTWVVIIEGKIEAVFGLGENVSPPFGIPWFLASNKVNLFSYTFAKESKKFVDKVLPLYYPTMCNLVYANNKDSIKWLKWLGFTVEEDNPIHLKNPDNPFYKFYRRYK